MDAKLLVFALATSCLLLLSQVTCEPLEDQLPDTTGLFFGKRASHPNMNNLLFGRRSSYDQLAAKMTLEDARKICRNVQKTCDAWGVMEDWKRVGSSIFTQGQFWPSDVVACVCLCACPYVRQTRAYRRDNSVKVEPPNSDKICKTYWLRLFRGWPWSFKANLN